MDANELSNSSCDGSLAFAVGRKAALIDQGGLRPRNRLLATLPRRVISSLLPHLRPVLLPADRVLCDVDEPLTHVYFIETGLVSLVFVFENGTTAEMATVGREGLVGIDTLLGSERALGRYVVPVPGHGARDRDRPVPERTTGEPGAARALRKLRPGISSGGAPDRSLQQRPHG